MFLALVGATSALLLLSRVHDRQLERLDESDSRGDASPTSLGTLRLAIERGTRMTRI